MEISEIDAGEVLRIRLHGDLDIYAATQVKERLLPLISQHRQVEIDVAGVSDIDCAGVQLLLAAKQLASSADHLLKLSWHSRPLIDALELCRLLPYFADPVIESPNADATGAV